MRLIYLFLIVFLTNTITAQKSEIVTITTTDRILEGHIGDEFPITVYLKTAQRSDNIGYVFSVSGWYKYDKIGKALPLAGVWGAGVHLFVTEDEKLLEGLKKFEIPSDKGIQRLDNNIYHLEQLTMTNSKITERFHLEFDEHRISGRWKSKGKDLWVSLNSSNSDIYNKTNYLKLPNGTLFNLSNLGLPGRTTFTIEASANNGQNQILHYTYHANLNYGGRCGGGTNSGKIAISFDKNFNLKNVMKAEFQDCYQEIVVDDLTKISEKITEYKIQNYSASKEHIYEVNLEKGTIVKKK